MSRDRLTPVERTLRARMGAYVVHARYDPRQTTAPARQRIVVFVVEGDAALAAWVDSRTTSIKTLAGSE